MAELRLGRLPDRNAVRLAISVSPDLKRALDDYASAYEAAYGQAEAIVDLIPFMLASFLDSDREFARMRKARAAP